MARRKDSPQKAAMREMMRDYLKNNDISIKDGTDVNSIMRDMMSVILEGALDEELDEELGYGYSGFLFYDDNGMPLVAMHWEHRFHHMVSRYNEIYKVQMPNITPHVCRHTYCSNMAKSGMNPKTLQYLMGHSDIAVTLNVYTHVGLEDAEKELQKMQGLENARKEMGISDTDDKPLKQNMFKVV